MTTVEWTAPTIPRRVGGWERAASEVLARHIAEPFEYGSSDCLLMPADLCFAMTGVDPMAGIRGYHGEAEADALLAALGFSGVAEALAAVFPEIPVAMARRFDAGIYEAGNTAATVIVTGSSAVGKTLRGPMSITTLRLKRAFAIGAR